MRILTLISPSRLGGAERYSGRLCAWEGRQGHTPIIAVKSEGAVADSYRELGLDTRIINFSGKLNFPAIFRIARLIREENIDIVHTHLSSASVWGSLAARRAGVPCVAHVHALNSKTTFVYATRVIAVSNAVKKYLVKQGMDGERIDVVWPAFGEPPVEPPTPAPDIAALGSRVVVCAAHLRETKGVFVLMKAWRAVIARVPNAVLVFAGEGPAKVMLEMIIERAELGESVRLIGFRNDMLNVFAAARCAVLPSIAGEGLPGVIAEANSVGVPAVGTSISGVPEIISDNESGYLVPPRDPESLAQKIISLLTDDSIHECMSCRAREVSKEFTMDISGAGCLAVFDKAIAKFKQRR